MIGPGKGGGGWLHVANGQSSSNKHNQLILCFLPSFFSLQHGGGQAGWKSNPTRLHTFRVGAGFGIAPAGRICTRNAIRFAGPNSHRTSLPS